MAIDQSKLDRWFSPTMLRPSDQPQADRIRQAGKTMAEVVIDATHPCADQSDAIRKIREAVATAIESLRCGSV